MSFADLTGLTPQEQGIVSGQYRETLNEQFEVLNLEILLKDGDLEEEVVHSIGADSNLRQEWLSAGIAAIYYFVQCNWTGPADSEDVSWLVHKRTEALQKLAHSDQCNDNVVKPELLYFAKTVFAAEELQKNFQTCLWWLLRANYLHQIILEESSNILLKESEGLIHKIENANIFQEDNAIKALFNIEATQLYLHYKRTQSSEKHLKIAQEICQLTLKLQGAMGKRTKFQQDPKPQLYLHVEIGKEVFPFRPSPDLPKPLELNDELRLERIEFTDIQNKVALGSLEESAILATW